MKPISQKKEIKYIEWLSKEESSEYFDRLFDEVSPQMIPKNCTDPHGPLFIYGRTQREFRKYEVLEELISTVEDAFEIKIDSVQCYMFYKRGDIKFPESEIRKDQFVNLSLGVPKLLKFIRNKKQEKEFILRSGDILFIPPHSYKKYKISYPELQEDGCNISVVFFVGKLQKMKSRRINLLRRAASV